MVGKDTKIYQKMKNKSWLNKEKMYKIGKNALLFTRNYFLLENLIFSWGWVRRVC